ncbi:LuxR C-terminal-related transcriptional regulator [Nocardiopsis alba]|uniref:Bacterial regulatory s, luxR family protein n=1 Tax=Nocardiopsis alba (strain ATCC BAA-2165 / BE74) TaxID=1205910 RepID=J7L484_NOCAA|nr:response regulator transcription factor [Nocardiopsis alba]AFR07526.1 bacterial regulatory s, luxR family protein [Nocardiopsis alba ATCC BAA-2165]
MIRVLLADDQALVRAGFGALLNSEPDIEVVAEAGDGDEAIRLARSTRPTDGLTATGRILADPALERTRIVILTTFDLDEYIFEALRSGASGFLVKDTEPRDLLQAVRVVHAGEALLSPGITRRLIADFVKRPNRSPGPSPRLNGLTDREREVLSLVGRGLSNEEIAGELVLSPATAKTHVSRAMVKLGVRDRAQLVVLAYETGLVTPGRAEPG